MAYDLEPEIKEVLEKIDFIQRYKALSKQFPDRKTHLKTMKTKK